jgi:hypothetical protein
VSISYFFDQKRIIDKNRRNQGNSARNSTSSGSRKENGRDTTYKIFSKDNQMKKSAVYANTAESDGVNYREIAETMTEIGFKMNHSSARNYVLRVMSKFATEIVKQWDIDIPAANIEKIVKTPQFQQGICEVLQKIEIERRAVRGLR